MERAYFIYASNKERDKEIARDLHNWLPTNIDIIEGKIKEGRIVDLYGNRDREVPNCLINLRRPIYLAEDALNELVYTEKYIAFVGFSSNIRALEFLKLRGRDTAELIRRFIGERRIVSGERNINDYISELKRGGKFIF